MPVRPLTPVLAFALLAAALPVIAEGPPAKPGKPAKPAKPAATAAEPVYDPNLSGPKALEAAAQAAFRSGRRLFVNFGTNDCAACRVVNDVMHEPQFFEAFVEQFVPVFIDVTPGTKNAELLGPYGIDRTRGLPACAYFDSDGTPLEVDKSGELAAAAGRGKEAVREYLLKRFRTKAE
ncbi:MAG: thioredoxin family protein [Acidobacteria bacterium ACB2]|nr:thioredoxin family protein [Acidobacteria bacterium ACB2]